MSLNCSQSGPGSIPDGLATLFDFDPPGVDQPAGGAELSRGNSNSLLAMFTQDAGSRDLLAGASQLAIADANGPSEIGEETRPRAFCQDCGNQLSTGSGLPEARSDGVPTR